MAWMSILAPIVQAATNSINNSNQLSQQGALDQQQLEMQEQAAYFGINLSNTQGMGASPVGQVNQLERAGLNPALLYGKQGPGGSMVSGMGIQGANAPTAAPLSAADILGIGLAGKQTEADVELKKAQTNKLAAETPTTGNLGDANLALTQQNTKATEIANKIQGLSADDQIEMLKELAVKYMNDATISGVQAGVQQTTAGTQVQQAQAVLAGQLLQNGLTGAKTQEVGSNIQVNAAQIKKMGQDILQGWKQLDINGKNQKLQALATELNISQQGKPELSKMLIGQDYSSLIKQIDIVAGVSKSDFNK